VQSPSTDTGNFTKMQALATQAKAQGAALIIFPEASVFGWLNPAVFTQAAPIPGRALCPMPIRPMTPAF
jgi:predicted amidohydrolase